MKPAYIRFHTLTLCQTRNMRLLQFSSVAVCVYNTHAHSVLRVFSHVLQQEIVWLASQIFLFCFLAPTFCCWPRLSGHWPRTTRKLNLRHIIGLGWRYFMFFGRIV